MYDFAEAYADLKVLNDLAANYREVGEKRDAVGVYREVIQRAEIAAHEAKRARLWHVAERFEALAKEASEKIEETLREG